jgi:hypothetical protein
MFKRSRTSYPPSIRSVLSMSLLRYSASAAILYASCCALAVRSQANELHPSEPVATRQIADWIRDLDAVRFADRQRASTSLRRLGAKAIPALTEAALGKSREASTRATLILRALMETPESVRSDSASGDLTASDKAELSLERIANSGKPAAAIARRALQPPPGKAAIRTFEVSSGEPIENPKDSSVAESSLTGPQTSGD